MNLPKIAEVVIIGGGVMGASTAYHLAKKGCRNVVLLERNGFFGMEATGKCAGGIRYQFDTEINIRLSLLSLPMLDQFEAELGQPIGLRKCGYLFVLTQEKDIPEFRRQVSLQKRLGCRTQWLKADEIRKRLPLMNFPDAKGATWGPDDGLADPNSVVQGYISGAKRLGALCLTEAEVTDIRVAGSRIQSVETRLGSIEAHAVVNAAGPWASAIGRMAGVEIPISPVRRQVVVTASIPELPPDFPFVIDFSQSLYFHREGPGVLTGMSNPSEPPGFDQNVDREWELVHLEAASKRMPVLEDAGIANRWAGLYENTPDAHPILGAVKELPGFYCITGFSGHGFMHGPACGLLLAEEIVYGKTRTLDISRLQLERFKQGKTPREYNVV